MSKLSHSAMNRYLSCAKSYQYHYDNRLREKVKSGALLFGSAIDLALNAVLKGKGEPHAIFDQNWRVGEINGVQEDLAESLNVRYAESDFDKELLDSVAINVIEARMMELELGEAPDAFSFFDETKSLKKQKGLDNLPEAQIRIYNRMNWHCLRAKGHLMIDAYIKKVMPKIKKVISVQEHVDLKNDQNDSIDAYLDIEVMFELDNGQVVLAILDNKTSSSEYEHDAVRTSQQLALYADIKDIKYGGFIVLMKNIHKNRTKKCSKCGHDGIKADTGKLTTAKTCDIKVGKVRCDGEWEETVTFEVGIQIVVDEVTDLQKEQTLETADFVMRGIKAGLFPRNLQACHNFGKCPYYYKCHYGSDEGLVSVKSSFKKF